MISAPHVPFADRLARAIQSRRSPVVVGLDPRLDQLPAPLCSGVEEQDRGQVAAAYLRFCRGVIDAVAPLVPAVKPQAAFFEQLGPPGMSALAEVISYARQRGLLVILDGKRNDIGSTAQAYADGYLGEGSAWGADALTVNPFLGDDSLHPFVQVATQRGAGVFVLVKTSNPGGALIQDMVVDGSPLFLRLGWGVEELARASLGSCDYGAIGAVVGATYPDQLAQLRAAMPHAWLLVPGYGSQGAGAADVAAAFDGAGLGAIINNSRGIIFAHARPEFADRFGPVRWQDAVAAATLEMLDALRSATSAGKL